MLDLISCTDDVIDILLWITGVFAGRFSKFKEAFFFLGMVALIVIRSMEDTPIHVISKQLCLLTFHE